ncbi:MAG: hypothetical protein ABW076_12470 [Candidatus Thiodiazotropha sp.]
MNFQRTILPAAACAMTALLMPYELLAGGCEQTAHLMHQACYADARDDYKTALANCENLDDRSDRRTCGQEAKQALREDDSYCREQFAARRDACDLLDEDRYAVDPLTDPSITFIHPDEVDASTANPYVSLIAGHTYVLRAGDEGEETDVIHVTDETREIQGVECRVVVDVVLIAEEDDQTGEISYEPVEVTDDWVAQDSDGNVYYCGELSRNYEEGVLVDLDGSFESGRDEAKAGVLMMAMPEIGVAHRQEFSLGEAEDIIEYVDHAALPNSDNEAFSCADAGGCLMTHDFTPLEPEVEEFKYYIPGVGFVLAESVEDGELTEAVDQLLCVGDSLDILQSPACEIDDPEVLNETLCELIPGVFCE